MNSGEEFENYVKSIYSILLNLKDEGIMVSGGATTFLKGTSGLEHQIDVYYEFERAGVRHRVIIECKNWKRRVEKEKVQALESIVRDIPGVIGVIISKVGYQSGAKNFAQSKGILALTIDELPSLGSLIADRLRIVALPDENCIGEPFWTIMEMKNGKNTGVWFALSLDSNRNKVYIPLFFSKYHAELFFKQKGLDKNTYGVRGLPRYVLRGLIQQIEFCKIRHELFEDLSSSDAVLMFPPPDIERTDYLFPVKITREQLMWQYYGKNIPSINQ